MVNINVIKTWNMRGGTLTGLHLSWRTFVTLNYERIPRQEPVDHQPPPPVGATNLRHRFAPRSPALLIVSHDSHRVPVPVSLISPPFTGPFRLPAWITALTTRNSTTCQHQCLTSPTQTKVISRSAEISNHLEPNSNCQPNPNCSTAMFNQVGVRYA